MFDFPNTRTPDFRNIQMIDYDRYWRERGFSINAKLKEREEIILSLIPAGARVLDVGCGNSRLPVALKAKGCQVVIADLSAAVLDGFRAHGLTGESLDLEKITAAAWSLGQFDYIVASEVLEHTRNPEEIVRVLAEKTEHLILTVPNSAFYRYRLHLLLAGRFFTQWVYHPSEHLRFWSHRDFLDWLGALGLTVERSIASNGFSLFGLLPMLKNWWPNLFGHQIVYLCRPAKK